MYLRNWFSISLKDCTIKDTMINSYYYIDVLLFYEWCFLIFIWYSTSKNEQIPFYLPFKKCCSQLSECF